MVDEMKDEFGREYSIDGFIKCVRKTDNIIIFGAGKYGTHLFEYLQSAGIVVNALCDNNRKVIDYLRGDYPVKYVEDINEADILGYFIIGISRLNIVKIVKKQLEELGVSPNRIIIPLPNEKSGFFDNRIMMDDEFCMFAIREMWSDVRRRNDNHIVDYFVTNDLFRLVVFEHEMLSGWLDEDLNDTEVEIVEKMNSIEEYNVGCICDAIIIMNELKYEVMEERLLTMIDVPIISIWDVLKC